jgi:protein TonB
MAVADARAKLNARLIEIETAKPLPASSLTIASYVAPTFPSRALQREIEGWVDVQFTVATDGTVRDVVVAEASHELYFADEAARAVSQWRFEPRIFMDQPIEQRSYTRIRFTLAD